MTDNHMTEKMIPDEAAAAAHDVFWNAQFEGKPIDLDVEFDRLFHYALAAALAAWPGAFRNDMEEAAGVRRRLILPISTAKEVE